VYTTIFVPCHFDGIEKPIPCGPKLDALAGTVAESTARPVAVLIT